MRIHIAMFAAIFAGTPVSAAECWSPDEYLGCLVGTGVVAVWHGATTDEALATADAGCADPGPPPSTYSEACGEYADTRWYARQKAIDLIDYAATRQQM